MAAASRPVQPAMTSLEAETNVNESCAVPSAVNDSQAKESSIAMFRFKKKEN
jgi:hypothetical protein